MRAAVVALGCPKNRVDSEYLLGALLTAGYELTDVPGAADLVIITTCAFIRPAVAESERAIRRVLLLKRRKPDLRVWVAGCLVERYRGALAQRFPGVERWLDLRELYGFSGKPHRVLSTPGHYAYLKIADGCDNRCSYCVIPDIRGGYRSRPLEELVAEAEALAGVGVKELILVAQDTTLYGTDLYNRPALGMLFDRLERIPGVRWLRLMYAHPAHLTPDVLERFTTSEKLCRYIDLPIQHISSRILRLMNRGYERRDVERLLERLNSIPGMGARTTVLVGFPGETEDEFRELLKFVREAHFHRLSGYSFSPEPETAAARARPQVESGVARRRLRAIMRTQAQISRRRLNSLLGDEVLVLLDLPQVARTQWDAPEIDGVVRIPGAVLRPGEFLRVRLTAASTHDLIGEPVDAVDLRLTVPGEKIQF